MLLLLSVLFGTLCHSVAGILYPDGTTPPALKLQRAYHCGEDVQDIRINITGHLTTVEEELKTKMDDLETRLTSNVQNIRINITGHLTTVKEELKTELKKTIIGQESQLETSLGRLKAEILDDLQKTIVDQVTQLATNILPFLAGLNATVSDLQLQMQQLGNKLNNITSEQQRLPDEKCESPHEQNTDIDDGLRALDCSHHWQKGNRTSGKFTIYPIPEKPGIEVWCNMTTENSWTVILSRRPQPIQENFSRDWEAYKNGFGNASAEYWIGLEALHAMTNRNKYQLLVESVDVKGNSYSSFRQFHVNDESSKYMRTEQSHHGTGDELDSSKGTPFTTIDEDNDGWTEGNCAVERGGGGGWWYEDCGDVFPTGHIADTNRDDQMRFDLGFLGFARLSSIVMSIQATE